MVGKLLSTHTPIGTTMVFKFLDISSNLYWWNVFCILGYLQNTLPWWPFLSRNVIFFNGRWVVFGILALICFCGCCSFPRNLKIVSTYLLIMCYILREKYRNNLYFSKFFYNFIPGVLSITVGKNIFSMKHEFQGEPPYLPSWDFQINKNLVFIFY